LSDNIAELIRVAIRHVILQYTVFRYGTNHTFARLSFFMSFVHCRISCRNSSLAFVHYRSITAPRTGTVHLSGAMG